MTRASGSSISDFKSSTPLRPGELVANKYRLIRQIGEGAMGSVWTAKNEVLDVDIAIKFMRIDMPRADASNMHKRLLQEARAAARLDHPAIVRVFDFGQMEDNTPFIVMELLKGEPLSALLGREGKLEVTRALQMMLPIADALATAHGRGIVHRDIKPENIFIASDEYGRLQPKIVDFGIARFSEGTGTLTRSGALLGTPDYMAPEQARGEPDIDHRTDVWALCVVLYELMAGCRPFGHEGSNYLAVLRAIVHDPVRPILEYDVGDKALWVIIERGLRKRRQERWDTMRVFGESLALWLYERGIREDAFGASLKTGWLQAGIDGVKIDTTSMMPAGDEEALKVIGELDDLLAQAPASVPHPALLPPGPAPGREGGPPRGLPVTLAVEDGVPPSSRHGATELTPAAAPQRVAPRMPMLLAVVIATGVAVVAVAVLVLNVWGTRQASEPSSVSTSTDPVTPPAVPTTSASTGPPSSAMPSASAMPLPPQAEPPVPPSEASAAPASKPASRKAAPRPGHASKKKAQKKPGSFDLGF
ncbi:MAG: protein kinase [Polyangiaceae bacterium]|nr:protein kinase [Polyangiaceae bacterium]